MALPDPKKYGISIGTTALPDVKKFGIKISKDIAQTVQTRRLYDTFKKQAQVEFAKYRQPDGSVSDADAENVVVGLMKNGGYGDLATYYRAPRKDTDKTLSEQYVEDVKNSDKFTFTYADLLNPYNQSAAEQMAKEEQKAATKAESDKKLTNQYGVLAPTGYTTINGIPVPISALKSTDRPDPISMAEYTGENIVTPKAAGFEKYDALISEIWNKDEITAADGKKIRDALREVAPSQFRPYKDAEWRKTADKYTELLLKLPQIDLFGRVVTGLGSVGQGVVGATAYAAEAIGQQSKNIQEGFNKAVEQYQGKAVRPEDIRIEPGTETVSEDSLGSQLMKSSRESADLTTYGLSDAEKFAVSTTMSIAQNALNIAIGGAAAPALMGIQAGGQTAYDIGQRGGSMTQQLQGGFAAAAAEFAGESLSLRGLEDIVKNPAVGLLAGIKRIGAQMGLEFTEEAATEVMNIASDILVMGDAADLALYYKQFKETNPNADALWPTILKAVSQIGLAGLAGAISGGVMGSGARFVSGTTIMQKGSELRSADALSKLIETGKSLDPTSSAFRMANRLEQREMAKKPISDAEIGRQYFANVFAQENEKRVAFQKDLGAAGIEEKTAKAALEVYDGLVQGETTKRAATKLQNAVRQVAAQKAEIDADINVTRTEALTRVQPLYIAMQRAIETSDVTTFQTTRDKYMQEHAIARAKNQAAKLKAQNRAAEVDGKFNDSVADAEEQLNASIQKQRDGIISQKEGAQDGREVSRDAELRRTVPQVPANWGAINIASGQAGAGDNATQPGSPGSYGTEQADRAGIPGADGSESGIEGRPAAAVSWGITPNEQAGNDIEFYASRKLEETGERPDIQFVSQIGAREASELEGVKLQTGKDAFLVSYDPKYGNAFHVGDRVYINESSSAPKSFSLAHEAGHIDSDIKMAGMRALDVIGPDTLRRYAAYYRNAFGDTQDDLRSEMIADVYGGFIYEVVTGEKLPLTFGLDQETIQKFYSEYQKAMGIGEELGEASYETAKLTGMNDLEYSRLDPRLRTPETDEEKARMIADLHKEMMQGGGYVEITDNDLKQLEEYFPDLRHVKREERNSILKNKRIEYVRNVMRPMLEEMFEGRTIELSFHDDVIEARVYDQGISEVTKTISKASAAMLNKSLEVFEKAKYAYSAKHDPHSKKHGEADVIRWDYFYVPIKIENDDVGVRIAVRQMKSSEHQIYHWGIKQAAVLGLGVGSNDRSPTPDAISTTANNSIRNNKEKINKNPEIIEYSRLTFPDPQGYVDKDGNVMRYSYSIPEIKERTDLAIKRNGGERYYADLNIGGETKRYTGNDKAELEAKLKAVREEQKLQNLSRPVRIQRAAGNLLRQQATAEQYFEQAGEDYDVAVARALMGLYHRNGFDAGGMLSQQRLSELLQNSDRWKDKSALSYGREILARNLEDIAPTPQEGRMLVETYANPIRESVADMTRWQKAWAEKIGALKLNAEESAMVQLVGEGRIDQGAIKNGLRFEDGKPMDIAKIDNAVKVFREFYAEALKLANQTLVRNGYRPIYRVKNYFPHITEDAGDWQNFVQKVVKGEDDLLPTDISGRTDIFVPGKPWFSNFQQRIADSTDYDAVRGFSQYLEGVGRVIFLTDDIQRIRQLESAVRGKYSTGDPNSDLKGKARAQHLSNFAAQLLEYGNQLAGKKAKIDRAIEDAVGRKWFARLGWLKHRFGANAVGGNLSTALSNFIPITQALATMNKSDFARGMQAAISRQVRNDGLWEKSDFLMSRFGKPDPLYTKQWDVNKQKASKLLGSLFETVDHFTAETIVFGKYQEGIHKGLTAEAAMKAADEYAARTMAERTIGGVPTLFNNKTFGFLTQFQLEINNQWSSMIKDVPRWAGGDKRKIVAALIQLFLYSWLYNELMEKFITGRRPAFDPIGVVVKAIEDFSTKKMGDAAFETLKNVADQLPLGQLLTGGGRVPLAGALEGANPSDALRKALNGEESGDAWITFAKGFLSNFVIPAGGGQLRKTVTGIIDYAQGGRYYGDKLAYPIEQEPFNLTRAILFGSTATKEGSEFYNHSDGKALSSKKTEAYKEMRAAGIPDAHDFLSSVDPMGSGTNAGTLVSIATFDANGDGKPDYTAETQRLIAKILDIKLEPTDSVKEKAQKEADTYIDGWRNDEKADPNKLAEREKWHQYWMTLLGGGK